MYIVYSSMGQNALESYRVGNLLFGFSCKSLVFCTLLVTSDKSNSLFSGVGFALFEEITENWILQKRVNRSRYSSFGKELRERFTLVAVYKKRRREQIALYLKSKLLWSLFTKRAKRAKEQFEKTSNKNEIQRANSKLYLK